MVKTLVEYERAVTFEPKKITSNNIEYLKDIVNIIFNLLKILVHIISHNLILESVRRNFK